MKNIFLFMCVIGLVGCGVSPVQQDTIVYVDRAVPMCPSPPELPVIEYQTDKLTLDDVNNPGKVGMAYKHDVILLRTQVSICRSILSEYKKTAQDFSLVKSEIDKLLDKTP